MRCSGATSVASRASALSAGARPLWARPPARPLAQRGWPRAEPRLRCAACAPGSPLGCGALPVSPARPAARARVRHGPGVGHPHVQDDGCAPCLRQSRTLEPVPGSSVPDAARAPHHVLPWHTPIVHGYHWAPTCLEPSVASVTSATLRGCALLTESHPFRIRFSSHLASNARLHTRIPIGRPATDLGIHRVRSRVCPSMSSTSTGAPLRRFPLHP